MLAGITKPLTDELSKGVTVTIHHRRTQPLKIFRSLRISHYFHRGSLSSDQRRSSLCWMTTLTLGPGCGVSVLEFDGHVYAESYMTTYPRARHIDAEILLYVPVYHTERRIRRSALSYGLPVQWYFNSPGLRGHRHICLAMFVRTLVHTVSTLP